MGSEVVSWINKKERGKGVRTGFGVYSLNRRSQYGFIKKSGVLSLGFEKKGG